MGIIRKGNRFFYEVYYPKHDFKYMGRVVGEFFVSHYKKPDVHFYRKGRGYPMNEELLKMLYRADIRFILIPEDGKTRFRVYLGEIEKYLNGMFIHEPHTEPQRCIPLESLNIVDISREEIEKTLKG